MACEALFHDPCFLLGFLPLLLVVYWVHSAPWWRHSVLIVAGLAFYSLWDWRFAGLLIVAGTVDYLIALGLERSRQKQAWLAASLGFNLSLLFFFKYFFFVASSAQSVLDVLGVPAQMPLYQVVLPLGISFFTFKTLSYTIDVYRGEVPATRDYLKYLAFITLIADIVAGPIIRYREMSEQLDRTPRRLEGAAIAFGLGLFALGLFKKIVIADSIALAVDEYWYFTWRLNTVTAWLAAIGYALQLYFDFSGYSDMALGLGALLGLRLPQNFRAPYQALNPSDFWRRWHISLSTWLRDYLYIPLGGNRVKGVHIYANLMIVMVLGGLWHGAAWTFVLWGAFHGLLLVVYKLTQPSWDAAPKLLQRGGTFVLVVLGWVLFRARDVPQAMTFYSHMFGLPHLADLSLVVPTVLTLVVLVLATMLLRPSADRAFHASRRGALVTATLLAISLVFAFGRGGDSPFLYYQF